MNHFPDISHSEPSIRARCTPVPSFLPHQGFKSVPWPRKTVVYFYERYMWYEANWFCENRAFYTKIFPKEIQRIEARELHPTKSYTTSHVRQPSLVSVISSFALCAGLLCQTFIPPNGLTNSPAFEPIRRVVNTMMLDLELQEISDCGGKIGDSKLRLSKVVTEFNAELTKSKIPFELEASKERIFELEWDIERSLIPSSSKFVSPPHVLFELRHYQTPARVLWMK